jgi:hypothetical protein
VQVHQSPTRQAVKRFREVTSLKKYGMTLTLERWSLFCLSAYLLSALRHVLRETKHASSEAPSEKRVPFYLRNPDRFTVSGID